MFPDDKDRRLVRLPGYPTMLAFMLGMPIGMAHAMTKMAVRWSEAA